MQTKLMAVGAAMLIAGCGGGGGGNTPQPVPFEPGPFQPGPFEPGPLVPGPFEPGPFEPGPFEPGPFEPGPFEPEPLEPGPVAQLGLEGLYRGVTKDDRTMTSTILDTGKAYFMYSPKATPGRVAGFSTAMMAPRNGKLTQVDALVYNYEGIGTSKGLITGSYEAKQWLLPEVYSSIGIHLRFESPNTYDTISAQVPSLQVLKGSYRGILTTTDQQLFFDARVVKAPTTFTIDDAGVIIGNADRCAFTGTIKPRRTGNVYDTTLHFSQGEGCANPNTTASGIALSTRSGGIAHAMLETPPNASVLLEAAKQDAPAIF